jgi:hypothetical protein
MMKVSREDTQWAIAGNVATTALDQLARQLPKELQGDGSRVVAGQGGFAALLVFGDLPNETLARQLLGAMAPVYLLDFDDDAPVTLKLVRKGTRVTETRLDEHPAEFLEARGIVAPGYTMPSPVNNVGLVEGITVAQARKAMPGSEVEFHAHPRGVLVDDAPAAGWVAKQLRKRAYLLFRNPRDDDFSCLVQEPDHSLASYSPGEPNPNVPALDNVLGETTPDGILRVLAIPAELLGL